MALDNAGRQKLLDHLEEETLKALVNRVQKDDAPSSDLVLAWNICKDSGILARFNRDRDEPENDLLKDLPPLPAFDEPIIKEIG